MLSTSRLSAYEIVARSASEIPLKADGGLHVGGFYLAGPLHDPGSIDSAAAAEALRQAEADATIWRGLPGLVIDLVEEVRLLQAALNRYADIDNWIPERLPNGRLQWGWVPTTKPTEHPAGMASAALEPKEAPHARV